MHRRFLLTIPLAALVLAACGSDEGSQFGNGSGTQNNNNAADPEGTFDDPFGVNGVFAACANETGSAALGPADLVIMFDKSGSMGDVNDGFDPKLRWDPALDGMKAFVSDPKSATLSASLQLFPLGATDQSFSLEKNNDIVCKYPYGEPWIKMMSLSDPTRMLNALNAEINPVGATPTMPAVAGAISYAKTIASQRPKDKVAVLLVTDGEPNMVVGYDNSTNPPTPINGPGCTDNDIPHVAAAAKAAFEGTPSIATYVIGIGPSLDRMNAIAAAGGTKSAYMIDVSDPSKTANIFRDALDTVRASSASCDFTMPPPPDGKTLNTSQFNIVYNGGDGKHVVLQYSKDCSANNGWRYDNPAAPTSVSLCPSICNMARADRAGTLKIAFGCDTKGDLK